MLNKSIPQKSTIFLVLIISSSLAWGDQKKNNNPPPPPPRPAPQVRPAPAPRPAPVPVRTAPPLNRPNPGAVNPGYRPATGGANPSYRPPTGGGNPGYRPATGGGNPGYRPPTGGQNPTFRPITGGGTPAFRSNPGGGGVYHPAPPITHAVPTRGGGRLDVDNNNRPTHFVGREGQEAKFGSRGQIREVHDPKRNMTVEHGLRPGDRRVVTERNGRTLVSTGAHRGYMERPYLNRNGHTYYQRTYWEHGHAYARAYRGYDYRGVRYYGYVPAYRYRPAFYGWAYNPWPGPVYYNWGWGPAPAFYGGYFAPAPYYPTASLWLTDFLLAEDLKQDYEARQEAAVRAEEDRAGEPPQQSELVPEGGQQNPSAGQLSPEVKQMIDAEVQRQLAEERADAQSPQTNSNTSSNRHRT